MALSFNTLPKAVQAVILIFFPAVLAGLLYWFQVRPLEAERARVKADVDRLHADNLKNSAFEHERTEYLNRVRQLSSQLDTLRSIVPDEQATDDFMRRIFEAGSSTSVNVRTFVPQPLVPREIYVEEPFNVRLDGTYDGLLKFFDRLAHEQRIISVTGISLGAPGGGGMGNYDVRASETVGANCVVTTYFNKPQTEATPAKK